MKVVMKIDKIVMKVVIRKNNEIHTDTFAIHSEKSKTKTHTEKNNENNPLA